MCKCPQAARVQLSWGHSSCRNCGCTKATGAGNIVNYAVRCPNRAPYSRRKRFMRLLANTFGSRVSRISAPLVNALVQVKPTSVDDIYKFIRVSKNRAFKRYDALAYLAYHLAGAKIKPLTLQQQKWAEYIFREIQWLYGRKPGSTFPAYSWVLEQVLLHLADLTWSSTCICSSAGADARCTKQRTAMCLEARPQPKAGPGLVIGEHWFWVPDCYRIIQVWPVLDLRHRQYVQPTSSARFHPRQ